MKFSNKVSIQNKRARYEYAITDTYVCGMVLMGSEIKSIRLSKVNLSDAYCFVEEGEVFIVNMHIASYENGGFTNHEPLRKRKLLLNRQEISKIDKKLKEKGLTLIPLKMFINDKGFAKLEIGVGKGKKLHDKRDDIKTKDVKREMQRINY